MTTLTMDDFKIEKFRNGEWNVCVPHDLHPKNNQPIRIEYRPLLGHEADLFLPVLIGNALRALYANDLYGEEAHGDLKIIFENGNVYER